MNGGELGALKSYMEANTVTQVLTLLVLIVAVIGLFLRGKHQVETKKADIEDKEANKDIALGNAIGALAKSNGDLSGVLSGWRDILETQTQTLKLVMGNLEALKNSQDATRIAVNATDSHVEDLKKLVSTLIGEIAEVRRALDRLEEQDLPADLKALPGKMDKITADFAELFKLLRPSTVGSGV